MAVIKCDDTTAGRTYVAKITRDSDGYMWDGVSAWVAENTLTDAEQATAAGLATTTPVVSATGTHSHYIFTTPVGITVACHIGLYLTSYAVGDREAYWADYDPQVGQILEDTNEVQAELADGGRTDLLIDGIAAKTINIPASPAAVGSAMTVSDKTGFSLAATGLDAITATEPTGKPSTFPGWVMWLVQRFRRSAKTTSTITVLTEAGATLTTQAITDDGAGAETLGPPA
jgi:hypothetical protein